MLKPKFENFPKELQRHDQWVVWKGQKILYDPLPREGTNESRRRRKLVQLRVV